MRILEALKILEDATRDCKARNIDTPETREALDLLDPYCRHGTLNHFAITCSPVTAQSIRSKASNKTSVSISAASMGT